MKTAQSLRTRILTLTSQVMIGLLAVLALGAGAHAEANYNVIKLRSAKIALFDQPNGSKLSEVTREQFKGPWPVVGLPKEGHIQVKVDGKAVWVKAFQVETDKPITASAECGAVVSTAAPQSAATRGLGEECKK